MVRTDSREEADTAGRMQAFPPMPATDGMGVGAGGGRGGDVTAAPWELTTPMTVMAEAVNIPQ